MNNTPAIPYYLLGVKRFLRSISVSIFFNG